MKNKGSFLFVLPALLIICIFSIKPVFDLLYMSLHDWNFVSPKMDFVGFKNFIKVLTNSEFIKVIKNTVIYTFWTVMLTTLLGLVFAVWLNNNSFISKLAQAAVFSPQLTSMVSVGMIFVWLLNPNYGFVNYVLGLLGLPNNINWLSNPTTAMIAIIVVSVWNTVGYNVIICLAGLQVIPKEIYEAAELDHSGIITRFFKITVPMMSPTLFYLAVYNLIDSFKVFETVQIMTSGGPLNATKTIVYYIYEQGTLYFNMGNSAAAGVILMLILTVFTYLYFYVLRRRVHYR